MSICEKCSEPHDGSFGSGRFCSRSCANTQSHSHQTKNKIRNSVIKAQSEKPNCIPQQIRISKICPICNNSFSLTPHNMKNRIYCKRECYDYDLKHEQKFCKIYRPGPENRGGRNSKKGYYQGIWCDSTWELIWSIYHLEHNTPFERNQSGFPYTTPDNKTHIYYPDFKLLDSNTYIEIKNYIKGNDQYKIDQFPGPLKVLFRKDLNTEFDYVHSKYGKNVISLYD